MTIRRNTAILSIGLLLCLVALPTFSARAAETAPKTTATQAPAQAPAKNPPAATATVPEKPPTSVTINFQDVEIGTVISSISKITGRTFIVDPRVKGKVTVISSRPVPIKNVYEIFQAILQVQDFATVDDGKVTKIIPLDQAKHDGWGPPIGADSKGITPDSMVTSLFPLRYADANRLVAVLRPLLPPKSYMAAQPDSNTLIISDRAGNVARLRELVTQLDQDRSGEVEVIQLKHAAANDVVKVLKGLSTKHGKTGSESELRLIADERTNSVIVSGSEADRLRTRALIAHLDTPIESEGDTQVVFLKYAKAKDLTQILTNAQPTLADKTKPVRGHAVTTAAGKENGFSIQADEATNALIITASPATMKSLLAVIEKLDIRRPQVLIEAVIAEIVVGNGVELGSQWRATGVRSANDKGLIGGTNFSSSNNPGINTLSGGDLTAFASLSGFNMGYLDGSLTIGGQQILNLGALVTALASDSNSNILSTPSVVTMDNQEAEIVVAKNVPFITGSYTSISNTGSSTPTNPFTTVERQDVGLKLKVTPQINEGDTVRLDIDQEVSNLTSDTSQVGLQNTSTRSIKTSVQVDDGRILVLGGLISDDVEESVQKVPLLGNIPILGWLFRYTKTTHDKRDLMVFLRPTILRNKTQGDLITFNKYDYMRRLQLKRSDEGVALMPRTTPPVLPSLKNGE